MNKKVIIVTAALIYILSTYFSYSLFSNKSTVAGPVAKYSPPTDTNGNPLINKDVPKTEECPTNGELLTKDHRAIWERRRPLVVMIENSTDARPQSGLTSADVVYEAVAEGGITRFATVFYCKDSDGYIGPVRSARVYFVDFTSEYGNNPLYTHVGGANCNKTTGSGCSNDAPADALGKITKLGWAGYNDLNFIPFPVMWRDYDRLPNRATEHTVYSATKKLWDYAAAERNLTEIDKQGKKWDASFTKWKFKNDKPVETPITKVSFGFWEGKTDFNVVWEYDATSNTFKRINGGNPHIDKNNDKQIQSKNVIVVFMNESVARDGYQGGQHLLYKTVGEGNAIVFQDGTAIKGTWRKKDGKAHIMFYDQKGNQIALNRGQTFIEIVPKGNVVNY